MGTRVLCLIEGGGGGEEKTGLGVTGHVTGKLYIPWGNRAYSRNDLLYKYTAKADFDKYDTISYSY